MTIERRQHATTLRWTADDLITRQNVGVTMPEKINPGPVSARMSFFAPVCLLFFFVLITALSVLKRINIHPMHYLFVTAGFLRFIFCSPTWSISSTSTWPLLHRR